VWSDQFVQSDARIVLASVVVVDDPSVALSDLAAHRAEGAIPCLRQLQLMQLARSQPQSVTSDVQLSRFSFPEVGAEVAAFRFKVVTSLGQQDLPTFADLVLAVKDRVEIQATFQDVGQPVSQALETQVMSAMIRRTA
jgi:hypothetical protein